MSDTDLVLLDRPAPDVARLTLNRPERRNALSIALRDRFSDLCDELVAEGTVKAMIVAGNGPVFSAGFDLKEFAPDDPERSAVLWASADRFHHALLAFPVPTIACVGGAAMAGGFDVATMCDFRVAATTARPGCRERAGVRRIRRPGRRHRRRGGPARRARERPRQRGSPAG